MWPKGKGAGLRGSSSFSCSASGCGSTKVRFCCRRGFHLSPRLTVGMVSVVFSSIVSGQISLTYISAGFAGDLSAADRKRKTHKILEEFAFYRGKLMATTSLNIPTASCGAPGKDSRLVKIELRNCGKHVLLGHVV